MTMRNVAQLGTLSDAERKVLEHLDRGVPIVVSDSVPYTGDETKKVRAALIRLLILGSDDDYRLNERGLEICGAWIPDLLDLSNCHVPYDLMLIRCEIDCRPDFSRAILSRLILSYSMFPGLDGESLEVRFSIIMYHVWSTDMIQLVGARLGGGIYCQHGRFVTSRETTPSIFADRIELKGDFALPNADISGTVRLRGAQVGGDLVLKAANLNINQRNEVQPKAAVSANRILAKKIDLSSTTAVGEVCLINAHVSSLECNHAKFQAAIRNDEVSGFSFSGDGITVDGSAFFVDVESFGEFRLMHAKISGSLDFCGSKFSDKIKLRKKPDYAPSLESILVNGRVDLRDVWVNGHVTLAWSRIGQYLSFKNAKLISYDTTSGLLGQALNLFGIHVEGELNIKSPHQIIVC